MKKQKNYLYFLFLFTSFILMSCADQFDFPTPKNSFEEKDRTPAKVSISKLDNQWKLFVNDHEFNVKGVAINNALKKTADFGANVVRTYGFNEQVSPILFDEAFDEGLYINAGLYINREKEGFDYNNEIAVANQFEKRKQEIDKFKDHPALLFWSVGNEAEANYTNTKLWTAINDIAKYIHEVDPNHLVTTTLAGAGIDKIKKVKELAPDLDFITINSYAGGITNVVPNLITAGWDKPYMIGEYGPIGTWELPANRILDWGALIEETSTEKASEYSRLYKEYIVKNQNNGCIGSFVFLWGHQTHGDVLTWYGLFDKNEYTFPGVDEMQYVWTGTYPTNRAPIIKDRNDVLMNGRTADDNIKVNKESMNSASVKATDPDGDALSYSWMIMKEKTSSSDGSLPEGITGLITDNTKTEITFKAPLESGAYRLIVFVKDDANKKVASGVIPFYVN